MDERVICVTRREEEFSQAIERYPLSPYVEAIRDCARKGWEAEVQQDPDKAKYWPWERFWKVDCVQASQILGLDHEIAKISGPTFANAVLAEAKNHELLADEPRLKQMRTEGK